MAQITIMGLITWTDPLDPYQYQQLADNFNKITFHDHTPGRGVQIPMGGIAPGAVGPVQLSSDVPVIATGSILLWPGNVTPDGYLVCDGTAYVIATYVALSNVLGATYNNSPPSGYFNVPDVSISGPQYGDMQWIIKT